MLPPDCVLAIQAILADGMLSETAVCERMHARGFDVPDEHIVSFLYNSARSFESRIARTEQSLFFLMLERKCKITAKVRAHPDSFGLATSTRSDGRSRLQLKLAEEIEEFVDSMSAKTMYRLRRRDGPHMCMAPRQGPAVSDEELRELVGLVRKRRRVREDVNPTLGATKRQRASRAAAASADAAEARRHLPVELDEVRTGFACEALALARAREDTRLAAALVAQQMGALASGIGELARAVAAVARVRARAASEARASARAS